MKQIYFSPHLDDAVLSCGGAIHRQVTSGDEVLVITFFTGNPAGTSLSAFAREQHDYWGNAPRPMHLRCAEDQAALALLGAEVRHLGYLDAVYRSDADGQWLYTDVDTLLGEVHPSDPLAYDGAGGLSTLLMDAISDEDQATIYAPLGVGCHVDHQIVHKVGRHLSAEGYSLAFYEDFPYAERPGALESALVALMVEGCAVEEIPLDALDLAAKVSAVTYYRTQLGVLFGGAEAMPSRVWAFAATRSPEICLAERIWRPQAV